MRTDLSSTAISAGLAWCKTRRKQPFGDHDNAIWRQVHADGRLSENTNTTCHGGMRAGPGEVIANVSTWAAHRYESYVTGYSAGFKGLLDATTAARFYEWFCERSFFAPYVIAPSVEFARDVGFVFVSEIPANVALGVATMSRNCSENAHVVKWMYELVDRFQLDEDLAYALAFGSGRNPYGTVIVGHNVMHVDTSLDYLQAFATQTPVGKFNSNLSAGGAYRGLCDLWGSSEQRLARELADLSKHKADEVVIRNPFKPVVTSTARVTPELIIESAPSIKEYFSNVRNVRRKAA